MRLSHSTQAQSTASHCRLTLQESDSSRMHSKVSSDLLPSYIKATRLILEIFKMAGYFPDSPRISFLFFEDCTIYLDSLLTKVRSCLVAVQV